MRGWAWLTATLNRHSAVAIIAAVETFAKKKASDRERAMTIQA
jgi:hypothetical protein